MSEPNLVQNATGFIRNSVTFKIMTIFFLILILLIPTAMVSSLIQERNWRKNSVVEEISSKWGNRQTISGPFLTIPYKEYFEDKEGKRGYNIRYMHVLPDALKVSGKLLPEIRYRGIYSAVLYNADLKISGSFGRIPLDELNIPEENIVWSGTYIGMGISDMRGIRDQITFRAGTGSMAANPGLENGDLAASGVSVRIAGDQYRDGFTFETGLNLNGSDQLQFVPVGRETLVDLNSPWASPSFDGAFLPVNREVGKDGFRAQWKVLHLNRNFPQFWTGGRYQIGESGFGLRLIEAVDVYQKSDRTVKYSIMFIVFTFMAFFFSEVMHRNRLHPIQYLLVGLAIIIFYTLLVSISEHIGFDIAYFISAGAIIALITGYSRSILNNGRMSLTVCGILVILYGYLYLVLQQEDYALLMGSIGLFAVLAIVMYITRSIDWYGLKLAENAGKDEK